MFQRKRESYLPGWLWFFLALPLGLIVALLYRRRAALPRLRQAVQSRLTPARYVEPDSIPLDMHPAAVSYRESYEAVEAEARLGMDAEDVAMSKASAASEDSAAPERTNEMDDLKRIEGIGPSISALLREQGISTFRQLADTPVSRLDAILTEANLRRIANPDTWPEQAGLAAEGRWDELEQFQGTLKAGRRRPTDA